MSFNAGYGPNWIHWYYCNCSSIEWVLLLLFGHKCYVLNDWWSTRRGKTIDERRQSCYDKIKLRLIRWHNDEAALIPKSKPWTWKKLPLIKSTVALAFHFCRRLPPCILWLILILSVICSLWIFLPPHFFSFILYKKHNFTRTNMSETKHSIRKPCYKVNFSYLWSPLDKQCLPKPCQNLGYQLLPLQEKQCYLPRGRLQW